MTQGDASDRSDLRGTWLVLTMTGICMTVIAYNTTAVITVLPELKATFNLRPTTRSHHRRRLRGRRQLAGDLCR